MWAIEEKAMTRRASVSFVSATAKVDKSGMLGECAVCATYYRLALRALGHVWMLAIFK